MKLHVPLARNKADRRRKSLKIASRRVQKQGRLGPVCLLDRRDLGTFERKEANREQRLKVQRASPSAGSSDSQISWHLAQSGASAVLEALSVSSPGAWQVRLVCWPAL